jgi:hypothetical protein
MSFDGKWIGVRCFNCRNTKPRVMGEEILVIGYSLLGGGEEGIESRMNANGREL